MGIKAVIFDIGGVLLRTEDRGPRTELGKRFGLTYEEMEAAVYGGDSGMQAALGTLPVEEHWRRVCQRLNLSFDEVNVVKEQFWGGDRMDARLVDFLRGLRGRVKTALLSNAWADMRQILTEIYPVLNAFDDVIISAEVGLAKPDPRIYALAVSRLDILPAEAVFVDDMAENVRAAQQAGLHGVQFKNTDQTISAVQNLLEKP